MIDEIELPEVDEIEDAPVYPLAQAEMETLTRCEAVIARGVQTFIEVGEALAVIRDGKLYRADFTTFEHYCRNKWGIGDSRARQLIGASNVARHIESVTTVTVSNERQAREMMKLDPDQQVAAANRAAEIAGSEAPTAKHFQQAAAEVSAPALDLLALGDILLRLDAHGYAKFSTRQKGMTTFYSFRDFRSDKDDGSAGEIELAEGELPYWLAELDTNAAYAQAKQEKYLDAQARADRLGYTLRRDGAQFVLSITGQNQPSLRGTLDAQIKTIEGYEKNAAKTAAPTPDLPPEFAIVQRRFAAHGWKLIRHGVWYRLNQPDGTLYNTYPTLEEHATMLDVLDRALARQSSPVPDPETSASDRQAHLAKEMRDAGRIERARTLQEHGEMDAARVVLSQIEVSTRARDQLLATIPAGRRIVLDFTDDDCAALLREAKRFVDSDLTRDMPAIGQTLVLLVKAIKQP